MSSCWRRFYRVNFTWGLLPGDQAIHPCKPGRNRPKKIGGFKHHHDPFWGYKGILTMTMTMMIIKMMTMLMLMLVILILLPNRLSRWLKPCVFFLFYFMPQEFRSKLTKAADQREDEARGLCFWLVGWWLMPHVWYIYLHLAWIYGKCR